MKRFALIALAAALCAALCGCAATGATSGSTSSAEESQSSSSATSSSTETSSASSSASSTSSATSSTSSTSSSSSKSTKKIDYTTGIHHAVVKLKGYSTPIVFEIYSDSAPQTSLKFSQLVKSGYYNGKTLYWVLDGIYMKLGAKKQDNKNLITGEYQDSDYTNSNSLKKGVIALARAEDGQQSDASTIIIFLSDCSYLDGKYAGFGRITDGYEVLEDIMKRTQSSSSDSDHISVESNGKISKNSECPVIKSIKMKD